MSKFSKLNKGGAIDIPEGWTQLKHDDVLGKELTISAYKLMRSRQYNADTAYVTFKEIPDAYLFGNAILHDILKAMEEDSELMDEFIKSGLPVKFLKKKSKNNRDYIDVEVL